MDGNVSDAVLIAKEYSDMWVMIAIFTFMSIAVWSLRDA